MLIEEEFVELYLKASEEIKNQIVLVLEEHQSLIESPVGESYIACTFQ